MNDLRGPLDLLRLMRGRDETGLKLRGREVSSCIEAVVEEANEFCRVASARIAQIGDRSGGEKETKHLADTVKGRIRRRLA